MASVEKDQASCSSSIKVRCLIQQCINAKLQVKLADAANNIESECVEVYIRIFYYRNALMYGVILSQYLRLRYFYV